MNVNTKTKNWAISSKTDNIIINLKIMELEKSTYHEYYMLMFWKVFFERNP
jgi:hypothetical protein